MSQEKFVTGNLHRISDKLAEAAKKHEQELAQRKNPPESSSGTPPKEEQRSVSAPEENSGREEPTRFAGTDDLAVSPGNASGSGEKRKKLSDSMEAALHRHHEEALRLRRDLRMLLESTHAQAEENAKALERDLAELKEVSQALEESRKEVEFLALPDPDSPEYQMLLAALYRKMDKVKADLLHIKAKTERIGSSGGKSGENTMGSASINLFAEMHSLKKGTLFQTGFWMLLPLILGLLLAALLVAAAQILTFRVGL